MKSPNQRTAEKQIDTDATEFAEEVNYAVAHGGRELHPEQKEKGRQAGRHDQPDAPWQID